MVLPQVSFKASISKYLFLSCIILGIIIKEKCSPFNQGIIQQPIMAINNVTTPMIELFDHCNLFFKKIEQIANARLYIEWCIIYTCIMSQYLSINPIFDNLYSYCVNKYDTTFNFICF